MFRMKAGGSDFHGPTEIWGDRTGGCGTHSGNEIIGTYGRVAVWPATDPSDCDYVAYNIEDAPGVGFNNSPGDYYLEFQRNTNQASPDYNKR